MGSSVSSSNLDMDRKTLKRPDGLTLAVNSVLDKLASQWVKALMGIGVIFIVGVAFAFWMNHRSAQDDTARGALFLAEKSMETELKALLPPPPVLKKGEKASPAALTPDSITFQKFDVDSKLPQSVQKLKDVEQKYSKTRAAMQARLKLGGLYFNHGEYEKALNWYQKTLDSASGFEKAVALSALGYTYENLNKPTDALQAFQKALNMGEVSLKGDLLLAIARSYEASHDSAKARSTYDQILKDLSNTEYAKSAEAFKAQLQ
jgi:tetratricopeptide (TPR) repeat protein